MQQIDKLTIRLSNVSKSFGEKKVLDNLSYSFDCGECYVLQGKSGIGKSTLLNIISGYVKPDSGEVVCNDNIHFDYMFQDEMLFTNLTVLENLVLKFLSEVSQIE